MTFDSSVMISYVSLKADCQARKAEEIVGIHRRMVLNRNLRSVDVRLNGEEWVLKNGYRGTGSFPIHNALSGAKPVPVLSQASMIDARTITAIDLAQVTYFALSVFWRAGACRWDALDHFTQIKLGPYQAGHLLSSKSDAPTCRSRRLQCPEAWPLRSNPDHRRYA